MSSALRFAASCIIVVLLLPVIVIGMALVGPSKAPRPGWRELRRHFQESQHG